MKGEYFHVPLEQATTPTNGEAICDRWWAVHPEHGVCFYAQVSGYGRSEEPSPQCNPSEHVSKTLIERYKPDHENRLLPVVFMGHAVRALNAMRAARAAEVLVIQKAASQ
jgi:hypothetical protein